MTNIQSAKKSSSWVGIGLSLLAVLTCYGTLVLVALLSVMGVSVEINEGAWLILITAAFALALAGIGYSYRAHRHFGPLLLGLVATALLLWVFYGSYSKLLELIGFSLLVTASLWDFRIKKRVCGKI